MTTDNKSTIGKALHNVRFVKPKTVLVIDNIARFSRVKIESILFNPEAAVGSQICREINSWRLRKLTFNKTVKFLWLQLVDFMYLS